MCQFQLPVLSVAHPRVHEDGKWRPVGLVVTQEIVQQQAVGGILGEFILAGVEHAARVTFHVLVLDHRNLPHPGVAVLGARSNLARVRELKILEKGISKSLQINSVILFVEKSIKLAVYQYVQNHKALCSICFRGDQHQFSKKYFSINHTS